MVSERITRKHQMRKARIRHVYELIESEAKKSKPNLPSVAVEARTLGVPAGDMWRAFDAAAYVTDLYDADLNSSIHEALGKAGFERKRSS